MHRVVGCSNVVTINKSTILRELYSNLEYFNSPSFLCVKHHYYCPFFSVDHKNSCLFTNKEYFSSPLWVLIGVVATFHAQYFTNRFNWTLGIDFND